MTVIEWPTYGQDLTGDKAIPDGVITSQNVAGLTQLWTVDVGGPVSATPVISGGIAYIGSYDGTLYAINVASGTVLWTYDTGAAVEEPNLKTSTSVYGLGPRRERRRLRWRCGGHGPRSRYRDRPGDLDASGR